MELIFKKVPEKMLVSNYDLRVYKNIILQTSLHKSTTGNFKLVKGSQAHKYTHYISILIMGGSGLHQSEDAYLGNAMLSLTNNKIDYKYYQDINGIVERLQLLAASQRTGNTSLNNESYE